MSTQTTTPISVIIPSADTIKKLDHLDLLAWYKNLNCKAEEFLQAGQGVIDDLWDGIEAIQDELLSRMS